MTKPKRRRRKPKPPPTPLEQLAAKVAILLMRGMLREARQVIAHYEQILSHHADAMPAPVSDWPLGMMSLPAEMQHVLEMAGLETVGQCDTASDQVIMSLRGFCRDWLETLREQIEMARHCIHDEDDDAYCESP